MGVLARAWLLVPLLFGCVQTATVTCPDGRVCPVGTVCHPLGCLAPSQLESCRGVADRGTCPLPGSTLGVCKSEICIAEGCGDGFALGGEECDGDDFTVADCKALGYHDATPLLACNADCTYDRSVCGSRCGDGVFDEAHEDCDATALEQVADCTALDYYDSGPVTCTSFCTFDSGQCTGFCGDGVVNGGEFCDGSTSNAGCAAFGFDAGRIGCASGVCAPLFGSCVKIGWQQVVTEPDIAISAFWGSAPDDIWAVGGDLATLHFDGQGWTRIPGLVGNDLLAAIWGTAANDVWAVGTNGTIARLENGAFKKVTSPTTKWLQAVWGSAPDNYWAVGETGTMLHYNGQAWTVEPTLTAQNLYALWGDGPNNIWAVGGNGVVLQRTAAGWSVRNASQTNVEYLLGVWGDGTGTIWATGQTGDGYALLLRGPSWTDMGVTFFGGFASVWGSGPKDVWFVGGDSEDVDSGELYHYDGARIMEHAPPTDFNYLQYVWGTGPDNVWTFAYGESFARSQGTGWRQPQTVDAVPASFGPAAIYAASPTSIWAIGDGQAIRYDGAKFVAITPAFTDELTDVTGSGANDVWAVGEAGIILHSTNGSSWTEVLPRPFSAYFSAAWSPGPNKVIACGNGTAAHFDGQDWSGHAIGGWCFDLWGSAPNDVWGVGSAGRIYHFDGNVWTQLPSSPTTEELFTIWGSAANDVWAAGTRGVVLHYDGTSWKKVDTVALGSLDTLWGTASNDVWMAGQVGTVSSVYHYDGSGWLQIDADAGNNWVSAIGGVGRTILMGGRNGTTFAGFMRVLDRTAPWSCSSTETACSDAVDNDCDGKIDGEDIDCP
jgi:hypothetical protein